MTQRAEHSTVMDRLAIDDLVTGYAIAVDDGDWDAYRSLFTPDGSADYRSAGGAAGSCETIAQWLSQALRPFPVRQHLIVNRRIELATRDGAPGDTASVRADYLNPMRRTDGSRTAAAPEITCGGRYVFTARRTGEGWRLSSVVVHEMWRRLLPAAP